MQILHDEFIFAQTFEMHRVFVFGAGMIPALYYVLKKQDNASITCKAFEMIGKCLNVGSRRKSLNHIFQVDRLAVIHGDCLASPLDDAALSCIQFLQSVWGGSSDANDDRMQWPRMIHGVIAAMTHHSDKVVVQRRGLKFLKTISVHDGYVRHILRNGGLPMLYSAQKGPHSIAEADECLQHILYLDLRLGQLWSLVKTNAIPYL